MSELLIRRRALMMAADRPYTRLRSLISNGKQVISTGYYPVTDNSTNFVFRFRVLGLGSTQIYFGVNNSVTPRPGNYTFQLPLVSNRLRNDLYNNYNDYFGSPSLDEEIEYKIIGNIATCLGTSLDVVSYSFTNPLYFFAQNQNGATAARMAFLYSKFETSNGTEFELVPHLRNSDGKPGLLNLANGDFLTNLLTKEFGYEMMDGTIVQPQS